MQSMKKYLTVSIVVKVICIFILIFTISSKIDNILNLSISIILILLLIGISYREIKYIYKKNNSLKKETI